ncbi:MAG: hypothetical protein KAQ64_03145 [Candidatus Pacebacteria bacterium]|nr:hypothetical protein [Candidatus Paceibacterota bacterium]
MTENSFDKIKKLIKIIGGKAIIVEDGEPVFVVIDVDEYVSFDKTKKTATSPKKIAAEIVNRDVEIWKTRQDERKLKQFEIENDFDNLKEKNNKKEIDNEIVVEKL